MSNPKRLPEIQVHLLEALGPGPRGMEELIEELGVDQVYIAAAYQALVQEGLVAVEEEKVEELSLGPAGEGLAVRLPERAVIEALDQAGGGATLTELAQATGLEPKEIGQSLRFLTTKGWAQKGGANLTLTEQGRLALRSIGPDEMLLKKLKETGPVERKPLAAVLPEVDQALALLKDRRGAVQIKERARRTLSLTPQGREAVAGGLEVVEEVNQLSSELLASGRWREVTLRRYDVTLPVAKRRGGRSHPFRRILDQTRQTFLRLGFTEVSSPLVESSFFDFDALFQPQDHPAREMQDTFYLTRPQKAGLPSPDLVDRVRQAHENGGDTGSLGWQVPWDPERARLTVLRTHTTASTIRALVEHPYGPLKVFTVGLVFRREAVDSTHLPVFHQVDGIIVDPKASLADLLGTLREFYTQMGFERVEFRPSFFPYTEPSVEIFAKLPGKALVEMGGAGVFRPEVTRTVGCQENVLAWGLGLERLAMYRYELKDIRDLFLSDLGWIEEVPSCR